MEVAECPWREGHLVLRVGLKGKDIERSKRPASNLVFLLDVSGSMRACAGWRFWITKPATKALTP